MDSNAEVCGSAKVARAIAQQDRHVRGVGDVAIVGHGEILVAISIEVAHRYSGRMNASGNVGSGKSNGVACCRRRYCQRERRSCARTCAIEGSDCQRISPRGVRICYANDASPGIAFELTLEIGGR